MSNEMNGGSDLDIFEGLGKKASERLPAAPPPPPGSSAHVPAAKPMADAKRTLLGVAVPPPPTTDRSAAAPVAPPSERRVSAPPPLPPSERRVSAPPPIPTTPSTRPSPETSNAAPTSAAPEAPAAAAAVAPPPAARPASVPPPPPGRASLPNFVPPGIPASTRPSSTPLARPSAPPALSTRPAAGVATAATAATEPDPIAGDPTVVQPKTLVKNGAKLDMDWDDDQEATQIFDKESSKVDPDASAQALIAPADSEPERASMDLIMAAPAAGTGPTSTAPTAVVPPMTSPLGTSPMPAAQSPAAASATLSGAFGALGQPRTNGVPSQRYSAPPATQPAFTAPPAPPGSIKTAPMSVTPPPPPGQVTTAPMHMPLQPTLQSNMAAPHADTMQSMQSPLTTPPTAAHTSAPPPALAPSVPPPSLAPQLPPVSRAMDQTHMVPRVRPNRTPLIAGVVGVVAAAALGTFLLMPRTGTLVVNVADSKGGVVSNLEVAVDGKKACDSAPCIVRDISAGVHEVKVTAKGYELSAPRAVTIEGRKDQTSDFTLTAAKTSSGTGFKVASAHNGVKLSVDGKDIGLLPQELRDVSPGEHTLRFSGERYAPVEKTISVAKDEIVDLGSVNLKVLKGKATIQLGTPGAKVYIVNGPERKEVPQLPVAIEFGPNEKWELLGTKDGFDDFREPISFDDGQADKTFTVSLSPKGTAAATPRTVTPSAPAFVAAAPAREPAAPVAKAAPPPAPAETPKPSKAEAPAAAAATGEAVLKINSLPASNVVLDGKPLGMTPQAHVTVTPGSHTVMFVNSEQGLKKTITVDVKAGETKAAFAKLRE